MAGKMLWAFLALAVVGTTGCTRVQKGSVAGGTVGSSLGAVAGHSVTSVGSGPGALVGLAVGTASGAIAAEHYYGDEETGDLAAARGNIEELTHELEAKDALLAQARANITREQAQQKALLQAYDKVRQERMTLQASTASAVPAAAPAQPEAEGLNLTISSAVLFDSGKSSLTSGGKSALRSAARQIRGRYPDAQIEVRGHTDATPIRYSPYKSNWELSCARAQAVVDYLVESEGFSASQFKMVGCGDTQPIASNKTAAGRKKNRRAELIARPRKTQVADVR